MNKREKRKKGPRCFYSMLCMWREGIKASKRFASAKKKRVDPLYFKTLSLLTTQSRISTVRVIQSGYSIGHFVVVVDDGWCCLSGVRESAIGERRGGE